MAHEEPLHFPVMLDHILSLLLILLLLLLLLLILGGFSFLLPMPLHLCILRHWLLLRRQLSVHVTAPCSLLLCRRLWMQVEGLILMLRGCAH
jgi:hypothetical protein